MDKLSLKNKDWKDFYLSDFFDFERETKIIWHL